MKHRSRGVAMIYVLVLATVLFFLLAAAISTHYAMRQQNQRQADELQQKVERLQLRAVPDDEAAP